jgi:hypothetical protein
MDDLFPKLKQKERASLLALASGPLVNATTCVRELDALIASQQSYSTYSEGNKREFKAMIRRWHFALVALAQRDDLQNLGTAPLPDEFRGLTWQALLQVLEHKCILKASVPHLGALFAAMDAQDRLWSLPLLTELDRITINDGLAALRRSTCLSRLQGRIEARRAREHCSTALEEQSARGIIEMWQFAMLQLLQVNLA